MCFLTLVSDTKTECSCYTELLFALRERHELWAPQVVTEAEVHIARLWKCFSASAVAVLLSSSPASGSEQAAALSSRHDSLLSQISFSLNYTALGHSDVFLCCLFPLTSSMSNVVCLHMCQVLSILPYTPQINFFHYFFVSGHSPDTHSSQSLG